MTRDPGRTARRPLTWRKAPEAPPRYGAAVLAFVEEAMRACLGRRRIAALLEARFPANGERFHLNTVGRLQDKVRARWATRAWVATPEGQRALAALADRLEAETDPQLIARLRHAGSGQATEDFLDQLAAEISWIRSRPGRPKRSSRALEIAAQLGANP